MHGAATGVISKDSDARVFLPHFLFVWEVLHGTEISDSSAPPCRAPLCVPGIEENHQAPKSACPQPASGNCCGAFIAHLSTSPARPAARPHNAAPRRTGARGEPEPEPEPQQQRLISIAYHAARAPRLEAAAGAPANRARPCK